MNNEMAFSWLVLVVAAGTYLLRYLPFYVADKLRISKWQPARFKKYLQHVSSAIIAALLVVAFDPSIISTSGSLFSTLAGLVLTAVSWWRWHNTGLSVFSGIAGFAVVSVLMV